MIQEFVDSIKKLIDSKINDIHTVIPGKIVSYDKETGLATVLPIMKFKMNNGSMVDYPQITGVPVVFPQSCNQEVTIAYPIKKDDGCLIFVSEHSIEYWLYGQVTDTDLSFDLTDAFCMPGIFPTANSVMKRAVEQNSVIVNVKGTELIVKKDEIEVNAPSITLNGDVRINGTLSTEGEITTDEAPPENEETGGST